MKRERKRKRREEKGERKWKGRRKQAQGRRKGRRQQAQREGGKGWEGGSQLKEREGNEGKADESSREREGKEGKADESSKKRGRERKGLRQGRPRGKKSIGMGSHRSWAKSGGEAGNES